MFRIPHSRNAQSGKTIIKAMQMAGFPCSTFCIEKLQKVERQVLNPCEWRGFSVPHFAYQKMKKTERHVLNPWEWWGFRVPHST